VPGHHCALVKVDFQPGSCRKLIKQEFRVSSA
jgi:hypothetical protein